MTSDPKISDVDKLPIRVFISYSHTDENLVESLEQILRDNNLSPMRDRHFAFGIGFQNQIRRFIEHAHVFMPVVTEQSNQRGWVQQEIGYAMAQNIPVLPIAVGMAPGEWIQSLHAVKLDKPTNNDNTEFDLSVLNGILTRRRIEHLVRAYRDESYATYACARLQEDRARMLAAYCDGVENIQMAFPSEFQDESAANNLDISEIPHNSFVRQSGALTSFHIPDRPISDLAWAKRYGNDRKGENHCRLQREERRALERHAKLYGCRLIIEPRIKFSNNETKHKIMWRARIESLLDFLEKTDAGKKTEIVIGETPHESPEDSKDQADSVVKTENITIVGNWFFAIAITAKKGRGYNQTIFTRHAPSMHVHIEQFDEQFQTHLDRNRWTLKNCRAKTIDALRQNLDDLKTPSTRKPRRTRSRADK